MAADAIFRYDREADALYYSLTHEPVARTVCIGDRVNVDVDAEGEAVGIEVLRPPGFSVSATTAWQAAYAEGVASG